MNKTLRYLFIALLAVGVGKLFAQEVTLDFTLTDAENTKVSLWGFPASSSNKTVEEKSFTYGDYTVKVAGSQGEGYYWHDTKHYLLLGKSGAALTLPAFDFDVERIEVEGDAGASANTLQNVFVGETAVSTETKGAQVTNAYEIAADYQAAGNVYVIKVNSTHNSQIKTVKVYKKNAGESTDNPILTLKGTVGEEVSLTFGVWDTEDTYSVDFGDGELLTAKVGIDNKGPVQEDGTTGSATRFTGTVAGDGIIKVYGKNDIWYLITTNGAMPTSFDQPKLMNVVQMTIGGANVESVTLPAYEKMTQFYFNNATVNSVDVSKVAGLTNLKMDYTTLSTIDVSKNTELKYISLMGKNNAPGQFTSIDLSKNTKLESAYLNFNQLTEVKLASDSMVTVNVQNNKLETLDLSKVKIIRDIYASDNLLTSIDLSMLTGKSSTKPTVNVQNNKLTELTIPVAVKALQAQDNQIATLNIQDVTSTLKIQNNKLTFATLPAKPASLKAASFKYYAPQAALQVDKFVDELDLSSQLTATGILEAPATTTFSFVTADGTALVEGTDYEVTAPGKFKFLKKPNGKVHGVMASEAFPLFTDANAFVTTDFTVSVPLGKLVKKAEMTGEIKSLEALAEAKFMLQNEAGLVLYTPINWDVKVADLLTATSSQENGGLFTLVALEGDHAGQYQVPIWNFNGNRRTFWAGEQYLNSQPEGGNVIFGLDGTAPKYGQDGQDLALWTIAYEENKGFAFHCVGRNIYLGNDKDAARPVDAVTYWKAYTGYNAGYDEAAALAAYEEAAAALKTSDDVDALAAAKTAYDADKDVNKFGDAVNAAINVVNTCEALNKAYANLDATGAAVAAEVLAKYNAGDYANVAALTAAYDLAVKSQTTPGANMTLAIVNPSFETGDVKGWTSTGGGNAANNGNFGAATGSFFVEKWTNSANGGKLSDGTLLQTINGLPNGKYKLTAEMQNREQGNGDAAGTGYFLVANGGKTEAVTNDGQTIEVMGTVTNGTLEIGTKLEGCSGNWVCVDNFQLTFVEALAEQILTLQAAVGKEVSLSFGVYETEDTYTVDFGDGNAQTAKVGIDNKGPVQEDGTTPTATTFTGTVAGDGTIKVFGNNDIWYLVSSGAIPAGFDQAKLMNVVQMSITGADVESVALPAYEKMTQFSFNNSPVKTLDVTKVPTLTSLTVTATAQSEYEPQLESIDVSNNTELTSLSIQGAAGKEGKLAAIDLSKNIKLTGIYLQYNKLNTFTLPAEYTTLNNKGVPAKITLSLNNNELTALEGLDKVPEKSIVSVQNNKFTLATLPTKNANVKTYTYAPQAAYEVAETVEELDLSSQLTATGVLAEPATTTFSFVTATGTALVEGTDYEVTAPGKFKFLKGQDEKVHGVMATEAFPLFKDANAYVTTEFTVPATVGIQNVNAAAGAGKVYNLQGVEVKNPTKGMYIQDGKVIIVR